MDLTFLTNEELFRHAIVLDEIDPATGHELLMRFEYMLDVLDAWEKAYGCKELEELEELASGRDA